MTQLIQPPLPPPAPGKTLYDSWTVGIATFFGSPLAGTAVMALNYKRLGRARAAVWALLAGVLGTVLLCTMGYVLPEGPLVMGFGIAVIITTKNVARSMQGPILSDHVVAGGKIGTKWFGVLAGIVGLVVVLAVLCGVGVAMYAMQGTRLTIGQKDQIIYSGQVTEADAKTLGAALQKAQYFEDRGTTVEFSQKKTGTTLSFIVRDGAWDQPDMIRGYTQLVRELAPSVGGLPVKAQLLSEEFDMKKEWMVE